MLHFTPYTAENQLSKHEHKIGKCIVISHSCNVHVNHKARNTVRNKALSYSSLKSIHHYYSICPHGYITLIGFCYSP